MFDLTQLLQVGGTIIGSMGLGGVLLQWMKNRGDVAKFQGDELSKVRAELKADCDRLEAKLEKSDAKNEMLRRESNEKIEALRRENGALRAEISAARLDLASYRAAVRTMILQMSQGDPAWKSLASVLGSADHDVDKLLAPIFTARAETPAIRKPRILVVDDSPDARQALKLHLEAIGYDVETASSGVQALDFYERAKAASRPYELLILDQSMPNLSGDEVMSAIRAFDQDTRIVFLTGHAEQLRDELAASAKVWRKPLDFAALPDLVKAILAPVNSSHA